jgi:hypothetical protein
MLFNDYTSVLSWHACRARHIVLTLILDLHLYLWAYVYALSSYRRSYESVIGILHQSISYCCEQYVAAVFKQRDSLSTKALPLKTRRPLTPLPSPEMDELVRNSWVGRG